MLLVGIMQLQSASSASRHQVTLLEYLWAASEPVWKKKRTSLIIAGFIGHHFCAEHAAYSPTSHRLASKKKNPQDIQLESTVHNNNYLKLNV